MVSMSLVSNDGTENLHFSMIPNGDSAGQGYIGVFGFCKFLNKGDGHGCERPSQLRWSS